MSPIVAPKDSTPSTAPEGEPRAIANLLWTIVKKSCILVPSVADPQISFPTRFLRDELLKIDHDLKKVIG
jgi:hypothetical protein